MTQIFTNPKGKYDLKLKTPDNTLNICISILHLFNQIDAAKSESDIQEINEPQDRKANHSKSFFSMLRKKNTKATPSLKSADKGLIYYILSTSTQEFHESFMTFYKNLAQQRNDLSIDEQTFELVLGFLCRKDVIGKHKILKSFQKLAPSAFIKGYQLDGLLNVSPDDKDTIGPNMLKEMFHAFELRSKEPREVVDYIKFFPLALALFSEDLKKKMTTRKDTLSTVSGIEKNGNRLEFYDKSLLSKFESFGLQYSEKKETVLTMEDIEKALLLFRNSSPKGITFEEMNIVLADVQKKYNYNPRILALAKSPRLKKKFLNYLAYLVCMHSACSKLGKTKTDGKFSIIEEYILWNAVMNANAKLGEAFIRKNFKHYVLKNNLSPNCSDHHLRDICSNYLKKIIPSIQKQSLTNIISSIFENSKDFGADKTSYIADNLYNFLIEEAQNKLFVYIKSSYEKFNINDDPRLLSKQASLVLSERSESRTNSLVDLKNKNKMPNIKQKDVIKEEESENISSPAIQANIPARYSYSNQPSPLKKNPNNDSRISIECTSGYIINRPEYGRLNSSQVYHETERILRTELNISNNLDIRNNLKERSTSEFKGQKPYLGSPEKRSLSEFRLSRSTANENKSKTQISKDIKPFTPKAVNIVHAFLNKYSSKPDLVEEPKSVHSKGNRSVMPSDYLDLSNASGFDSYMKNIMIDPRRKALKKEEEEEAFIPLPLRPIHLENELVDYNAIEFDNLVFLRKAKGNEDKLKTCYCSYETCNLM